MSASDARLRAAVTADGVATLELCDASSRNALSEDLVAQVLRVLQQLVERSDVHVLVLLGLPDVFCSGASRDVLARAASGALAPVDLQIGRAVLDVPVPVIAAMEGHALGGGLAFGLCADLVLVARESRYGATFMNLGFTPGMGMTRLLEHVLSPAIAHEMLYTGQPLKGSQLEGRSGINYILPRAEVRPRAFDLAERIADKPRSSLLLLKHTLAAPRRQAYESARAAEVLMHQVSFAQPEVRLRFTEQYPHAE